MRIALLNVTGLTEVSELKVGRFRLDIDKPISIDADEQLVIRRTSPIEVEIVLEQVK